jgi:hypothetical protein
MSTKVEETTGTWKSGAVTVACVLIVALSLTWTYLAMRAVMNVGGSCADGGPYVSAQPCPDGSLLIAAGVPMLLIFSMIGTVSAGMVGAPNLLVPMWGVLFGSLGWNFLEYAFKGPDVEISWLVCGVVFWGMAVPAFLFMIGGLRQSLSKPGAGRSWMWLPAYGVLGAVGLFLGWASFVAVAG